MSNDPNAGGDISSGFGESKVTGPVSDEKAEQMKSGGDGLPSGDDREAEGDDDDEEDGYTEQDVATNEQDLTRDGT